MERKLIAPITVYALILIAVILTAYTFVGLYVTKGKPVSSLLLSFKSPDTNSVSNLQKEVVPGDSDNVRSYKYKGEDVTLQKYLETNGKSIIQMDNDIKLEDLTPAQRKVYDAVAPSVYRPCCTSPASQPDCSHGYAARGLIKYLATQNWNEKQIFDEVSVWHRFWWPKHYVGVALYMQQQGKSWHDLTSQELLSKDYSTVVAGRKIGSAIGISLY